jgi:acetyl-CoA carboxylase carboxyltransferase component
MGKYTARERIDRFVGPGTSMEMGVLNRSEYPEMEKKSASEGFLGNN